MAPNKNGKVKVKKAEAPKQVTISLSNKSVKFKNKKQKELFDTILQNKITFVTGAAGTGKTFISLYAGLKLLLSQDNPKITKLIFSKPIIEAAKSIGFLPGTIEEKVGVYMYSFYDNLKYLIGDDEINWLKESNVIKEVALNFVRGNTFGSKSTTGENDGYFCILDEAQNCTVKEMKLFLSRKAENTKMIILGDIDQSDLVLPKNELSGLEDAIKRFKGLPGVGHIEFTEDEIVRDPFMIALMKRYKMTYEDVEKENKKIKKQEPEEVQSDDSAFDDAENEEFDTNEDE